MLYKTCNALIITCLTYAFTYILTHCFLIVQLMSNAMLSVIFFITSFFFLGTLANILTTAQFCWFFVSAKAVNLSFRILASEFLFGFSTNFIPLWNHDYSHYYLILYLTFLNELLFRYSVWWFYSLFVGSKSHRKTERKVFQITFSIILNRTPELRVHFMRASCHGNKKITTSDLACVVRFKNVSFDANIKSVSGVLKGCRLTNLKFDSAFVVGNKQLLERRSKR